MEHLPLCCSHRYSSPRLLLGPQHRILGPRESVRFLSQQLYGSCYGAGTQAVGGPPGKGYKHVRAYIVSHERLRVAVSLITLAGDRPRLQ